MYLDPFRPGDKPEHIVSEDRVATFGHLIIKAFQIPGIQDKNIIGRLPALPLF